MTNHTLLSSHPWWIKVHYRAAPCTLDNSRTTVDNQDAPDFHDLLVQLEAWETTVILNDHGLHILLYLSAAKLLTYYHLSASPSAHERYIDLSQQELRQCINILSKINVTETAFTRYFNWPLVIIDRIAQDTQASLSVHQKLKEMAQVDPDGNRAYNWVADGFERRFKPR